MSADKAKNFQCRFLQRNLPLVESYASSRNCVWFSVQFAKMNGGFLCQVSFLLYTRNSEYIISKVSLCPKVMKCWMWNENTTVTSRPSTVLGSLVQSLHWISRKRNNLRYLLTNHQLIPSQPNIKLIFQDSVFPAPSILNIFSWW